MNRFLLTSLLLISLTLLSGCIAAAPITDGSATESATSPASNSAVVETTAQPAESTTLASGPQAMSMADMAIEIDGTLYQLLGEAAGLIAVLGEPAAFSEAPSCLYEGTDKTYEFDDLVVYTITKNGVDLIDGIDLISSRYSTRRGITVGSSRQSIIDAYGEPDDSEYDLIYWADAASGDSSPTLTIMLDQDKVSVISLYSGSNNQAP